MLLCGKHFVRQYSVTNEDLDVGAYQEVAFRRWMVLEQKENELF